MSLRYQLLLLALATCLFRPAAAHALETVIVGPRALGMGGANVASVNDITAQHYNPAAFAFFGCETACDNNNLADKDWGLGLDGQVGERFHGRLYDYLDTLADVDLDVIEAGVTNVAALNQLVQVLGALPGLDDPGNAFTVDANAGLGVRVGSLGIGARSYIEASGFVASLDLVNLGITSGTNVVDDINAIPVSGSDGQLLFFTAAQQADLAALGLNATAIANLDYLARVNNLDPAQADGMTALLGLINAGGGGPLDANETVALVQGVGYLEVPITYGIALNDHWGVGANLKFLRGRVYGSQILVFGHDFGDFVDELEDNYKETDTFGVDIGLLGRFPMFNLGLTARNLNRPTFKGPTVTNTILLQDGTFTNRTQTFEDVVLERQVTGGVAFIPLSSLTLEVDYDLTQNKTVMDDYLIQNLSLGLEWNPLNILALRLGGYKNTAESDIGWVYTAGIGVNMWAARLDIGGAYAADTVEVEGEDVPKELRLSAQLVVDF